MRLEKITPKSNSGYNFLVNESQKMQTKVLSYNGLDTASKYSCRKISGHYVIYLEFQNCYGCYL